MTTENLPAPIDPSLNVFNYTKEVWLIHGANASPSSFNYIREMIEIDPDFKEYALIDIKYNCQDNIASIVDILAASASRTRPIYIVGHSLGGVIAARVSQKIKHFELPIDLRGIVTMSAPFGGSESADYLRWLYPKYHLFANISTQNKTIVDLQAGGAVVPTLSLVTSSGNNPLIPAPNDGVVTIKSQRALPRANYVEVPYNHFEVMVSPEAVDHTKVFLKQN